MRLVCVRPPAFVIASCVLLSALVAGCQSPTAPSSYAPFSKTDLVVGTGASAVNGSVLTVNYTGWLYNGSRPEHKGPVFGSSLGSSTPFTFTLGTGTVIRGWDEGLVGMNVGGIRRLIVPPSMAYGGTRASSIPPNATLLFEVELLSLQ